MSMTKPDDETVITVCLNETDFATACAKLNVSRGWLTRKLAQIELNGGYHRRSNSPILIRDAR
jgi:hypothetical protein